MSAKSKRVITMVIAVVLALAILASCILPALAANIGDVESEQSSLEEEAQEATNVLNATEEEIAEAQAKIDAMAAEISTIEADMKLISNRIDTLNEKIVANERLLESTEEQLVDQQQELKEYYAQFKDRIQMMYENDRTTYVELLFSARSLSDFFSRLEYISQVVEYDNNIMEEMNECAERIAASKQTIELTKTSLVEDRQKLEEEETALQSKLEDKNAQLESLQDDKLALELLRQEQEEAALEMWIKAWENAAYLESLYASQTPVQPAQPQPQPSTPDPDSSSVQDEDSEDRTSDDGEDSEDPSDNGDNTNENSDADPTTNDDGEIVYHPDATGREVAYGWSTWPGIGSGQLSWPIDSYLATDLYGSRTDPISGVEYSFHSGLDLNASYGQAVCAAGSGTVLYAVDGGWNNGFGSYVTIVHDDGTFMTQYCHLSSVWVTEGQHVEAGEAIGGAGSTGYSTGTHLHFMVWYGGSLTNPEWYL